MGTYSDKLWAASRLINEYNQQLEATQLPAGIKPRNPVNTEKFVEKLVLFGGVADELLRQCSWEDLEHCGLPRLLARKVADVFRAKEVTPDDRVRKWMPLLKKWKLSWTEHLDLVDLLDATVQEHLGKTCPDRTPNTEVVHILEKVKEDYLSQKYPGQMIIE